MIVLVYLQLLSLVHSLKFCPRMAGTPLLFDASRVPHALLFPALLCCMIQQQGQPDTAACTNLISKVCNRMLRTWDLQCCPCMLPVLLCSTVCERRQQARCLLSSHQSPYLSALATFDAMLQAAEEAQQRIEQAAAEAAKQAPEKGDIAAQVVRGTAQGVKREAVPTAKVRHRLQSCPGLPLEEHEGLGLPMALGA